MMTALGRGPGRTYDRAYIVGYGHDILVINHDRAHVRCTYYCACPLLTRASRAH